MSENWGHTYTFVPGDNPNESRTVVTLHGTGGTENDLVDLGHALVPGASVLSPRGNVNEGGLPRFFRRFAPGVFDMADLHVRADALSTFVQSACVYYGLDPNNVVAVGYSNGGNMALATLIEHPATFAAVVAIRSMMTVPVPTGDSLALKHVLLLNGRMDPMVPLAEVCRLEAALRSAGADVTATVLDASHGLTRQDYVAASDWLRSRP